MVNISQDSLDNLNLSTVASFTMRRAWNINKGSELKLFFIVLGYGRRLAHKIFHKIRHLERAAALFILLQPIVIDVEKPKPMKKDFHQLVTLG